MGTFGQGWLPFASGTVDAGRVSPAMLGSPIQRDKETYILVQCATGTDIASGSNGKLLTTSNTGIGSVSAGPSFKVVLTTGIAEPMCVGMVSTVLTQAISGGSYFLALRDSPAAVGIVIAAVSGGVGSFTTGVILKSTSGALLSPCFTAATTATASVDDSIAGTRYRGCVALESLTGVAAVSGMVSFHAPFRASE